MAATPPPWRYRAGYYLLGFTPPLEYREWVERDVASTSWLWLHGLRTLTILGTVTLIASRMSNAPYPIWPVVIGGGLGLLTTVAFPKHLRRITLSRYERGWAMQLAQREKGAAASPSRD